MSDIKIPLLGANDVELRVQQVFNFNNRYAGLLLVYKNARVDMRILDDTFGVMGWKRSHEVIKNNLFCTVSVRDKETGEWISKQDVGIESNGNAQNAQKGEASDAFKRACTNWGIGRELYDAPNIFINLTADEIKQGKNGKPALKSGVEFSVSEMRYNKEMKKFDVFTVVDRKGVVRFSLNTAAAPQKQAVQPSKPQTNTITPAARYILRKGNEIMVLSQNGNMYPLSKLSVPQLQHLLQNPKFAEIQDDIQKRISTLNANTAVAPQKQAVQPSKPAAATITTPR